MCPLDFQTSYSPEFNITCDVNRKHRWFDIQYSMYFSYYLWLSNCLYVHIEQKKCCYWLLSCKKECRVIFQSSFLTASFFMKALKVLETGFVFNWCYNSSIRERALMMFDFQGRLCSKMTKRRHIFLWGTKRIGLRCIV